MNKIIKLVLFAIITIIALPLVMFAQDSTHVVAGLDSGFLSGIFSYIGNKYPIVATISTIHL